MRQARFTAAVLLMALAATAAEASLQGIIGFSGKQSDSCDSCHDDGIAPLVELEGPTRFAAETRAQFRFVVQSQGQFQTLAGFNVAASAGVLVIDPEQNGRVEINDAGTVVFEARVDDDGDCGTSGANFDGIFRGPDATTDAVVTFGSPVLGNHQFYDSIHFGELNSSDQMSFTTTYSEPLVMPVIVWRADM